MYNLSLALLTLILSCQISNVKPSDSTTAILDSDRNPCSNQNNPGLPSLLWKKEFIETDLASTITPILTDSFIIISRSADFNLPDEVLCYNKSNGQFKWSWSDYFNPHEILNDGFFVSNLMMYVNTYGSMYIIDLLKGNTLFKRNYGSLNQSGTYGDDHLVSLTFNTPDAYKAGLFNSTNRDFIECISIPKSPEYKGLISVPYVMNSSCFLSFNSYHFDSKEKISELYRVDLENETAKIKWKLEIKGNATLGNFGYQVLGDRLYVVDRDLYCINIYDGSILWQQPDIFGGPGELIIADYKLIVATNHLNPSLMAFNLMTGAVIWNEPLSGTASPLQFHDCVLYTVGGGDGLLHAVDVSSGKHLYKMVSPDTQQNSDLYFDNCTVDHDNNKIILTNFRYLMSYQLPEY
jgi:outer membrane protein assembly factor BamB